MTTNLGFAESRIFRQASVALCNHFSLASHPYCLTTNTHFTKLRKLEVTTHHVLFEIGEPLSQRSELP